MYRKRGCTTLGTNEHNDDMIVERVRCCGCFGVYFEGMWTVCWVVRDGYAQVCLGGLWRVLGDMFRGFRRVCGRVFRTYLGVKEPIRNL